MLFQPNMKKILAARGYRHCKNDDDFTLHGDYARHIQYAFSKEFLGAREKIVDIIYIAADILNEKLVIGFFRENVSIENGVLENADTSIPLTDFSLEEFEKRLDKLIPKGNPVQSGQDGGATF